MVVLSTNFHIPAGQAISIKLIHLSTLSGIPFSALFAPPLDGHDPCRKSPSLSFLLEHPSGQKLLFDLGIRKDHENYAPVVEKRNTRRSLTIDVEKNVIELLQEHGLKGEDINGIVLSHHHWDHLGDPSTFPPSTDLIVGEGFTEAFVPGWPTNPDSPVLESDYEGRKLHEIDFSGPQTLRIGPFRAYDYFADGSLYLLDTPGHAIGHLCALVRTTTGPDTFVLLGGDACHSHGEFRPSKYHPAPSPTMRDPVHPEVYPGKIFKGLAKQRHCDTEAPLFQAVRAHDMPAWHETVGKLQDADGKDNILIVLAHDRHVMETVEHFPKSFNDWRKDDLAEKLRWAFLRDIGPYVACVE